MRAIESTVVFSAGALCYWALELAWRGWTHWTMPLTGGFCFLLMYAIANFMDEALWKKWVMSAACLTAVEFVVGILVNIRLGWHVWDYSGQRFHLYGQICPRFTLLWGLLSIPGVFLCNILRYYVFEPIYRRGDHSP